MKTKTIIFWFFRGAIVMGIYLSIDKFFGGVWIGAGLFILFEIFIAAIDKDRSEKED